LQAIADEYHLKLMYDAAHAFGCTMNGRMIGHFGACEVFSFHATKFFNSLEGGAVVTEDDALAQAVRLMRNFGFSGYDNVIHPGTNGKMIEACAAMGLTNLDHLDTFVEANRRNLKAYQDALCGLPGLQLRSYNENEQNNYQYIVLEVGPESPLSRERIIKVLQAENILARKYFWPGCHRMTPYRQLFPHARLMLPNTERVAASVVVLPSGSGLPPDVPEVIARVIQVASL
jgi:dTDP-4-amino-4,6-dideoxygalactose transaminase